MVNKVKLEELRALKDAGLLLDVFSYQYGEARVYFVNIITGYINRCKASFKKTKNDPRSKIYTVTYVNGDGEKKIGAVCGNRRKDVNGDPLSPIKANAMFGRKGKKYPKPMVLPDFPIRLPTNHSTKDHFARELRNISRDTRHPLVRFLSSCRRKVRKKLDEVRQNPGKAIGKVVNVGNVLAVASMV